MSFPGLVEEAEGQSRQQRRIVKRGVRRQKSMAVWRVRGSRHREWLTSVLICDACSREYPEDRDECTECGQMHRVWLP
jgi:rRNA maturation endonuclease Nob1